MSCSAAINMYSQCFVTGYPDMLMEVLMATKLTVYLTIYIHSNISISPTVF